MAESGGQHAVAMPYHSMMGHMHGDSLREKWREDLR